MKKYILWGSLVGVFLIVSSFTFKKEVGLYHPQASVNKTFLLQEIKVEQSANTSVGGNKKSD